MSSINPNNLEYLNPNALDLVSPVVTHPIPSPTLKASQKANDMSPQLYTAARCSSTGNVWDRAQRHHRKVPLARQLATCRAVRHCWEVGCFDADHWAAWIHCDRVLHQGAKEGHEAISMITGICPGPGQVRSIQAGKASHGRRDADPQTAAARSGSAGGSTASEVPERPAAEGEEAPSPPTQQKSFGIENG